MIVASRNELRSLLKNAFQGAKLPCGDYESAAETVLWAMATDRIDWQEFAQCLGRIESCKAIDIAVGDLAKPSLRDQSLIVYGTPLVDYAIAKALHQGEFRLMISQASDAEFLGKKLCDAAERGLFGILIWTDSQRVNRLTINPLEAFVNHELGDREEGTQENVEIFLTQQSKAFDQQIAGQLTLFHSLTSSTQCAESYQNAIENGIKVPHDIWRRLLSMAEKILVPNSEQSRLGAGE